MQVAKTVEDVSDTTDDIAQPFFFEIDLPSERFFQSSSLLIEPGGLRQVIAMLVAPPALVVP